MRLYFSPGACSLSPHIVLREAGLGFDLEQVDLKAKKTKSGEDFLRINPKGQVPVLRLDNGELLTEGPAIVQYIADREPEAGLIPAAGTMERYRVLEWLNFITSELHKGFAPLFRPNTPEAYVAISKENSGGSLRLSGWTLGRQGIPDGRQIFGRRRLSLHGRKLVQAHEDRSRPMVESEWIPEACRCATQGAGGTESRGPDIIGSAGALAIS